MKATYLIEWAILIYLYVRNFLVSENKSKKIKYNKHLVFLNLASDLPNTPGSHHNHEKHYQVGGVAFDLAK